MIIYNLRKPVETDADNSVGVTGENNSFTAKFLIRELVNTALKFSIHLRFADGSVNTVVPDEVNVNDMGTTIIWNVKNTDIFVHGFFDVQIEGRKSDGYVFQTEIVRMYADESIAVEDKAYENPNAETLKLRKEAYDFLCELKLQQDKLDENMKLLLATDITQKQDSEYRVSDLRYVKDDEKNYPSIKYLKDYYYDINETYSSEEINEKLQNKADNTTVVSESEGVLNFGLYSSFVLGQIGTSGTYNPDIKYRVISEDIMKFDYDLYITVDDGFTAFVVKYLEGSYVSTKSLSDTNGWTIPAGTEFKLSIRRNPENTSEKANISEFVNAVKFKTKIAAKVNDIGEILDATAQTANEASQTIGEEVKNVTVLNRTETHTANASVGIKFNFNAGNTYIIEYNSNLPVERVLNCLSNSYSSSKIVEVISEAEGATSGRIIYTAAKSGGQYIVFTSTDKVASEMTITGAITFSLREKINTIDSEVNTINDALKNSVYSETAICNSHSGGFVAFPFDFEVGKRYKITFESDNEIDYIYNQKADTINSSDRVEIITAPKANAATVYYTPTAEDGKYLVFRCADRTANIRVNGSIVYSLNDTVNSINGEIQKIDNRVTTLEDKINTQSDDNSIPDYYYTDNYLPNKIREIKQACGILNGVTFAFITDVHFKVNQKQSKKLLKKIMDETNVPFVIFGGDTVYLLGTEDDLHEQVAEFNDFKRYIGKDNLFCTRGNHDLYNATSTDPNDREENTLSKADVYDTLFRNSERNITSMDTDTCCYCIDIDAQRTRFIMLNTSDVDIGGVSFRAKTLRWLSNALTEKKEYKIIIVCHTPLNYEKFGNDNSSDNTDGLQKMVQAFKNKTTFETVRFNTTVQADFTETTNELICVISGHRHFDGYSVENNVLNIVTTCDCIDRKDGYSRKAGTVLEQAFDIFCINYDTKNIKTVRIGAGENREITY